MKTNKLAYLKWIIGELNEGLNLNSFTKNIHSPLSFEEIVPEGSDKMVQLNRLMVASEIYRWIMGGKWRLLDLEHILRSQDAEKEFNHKQIKENIKDLIDGQEVKGPETLKMCLLLTGIKPEIIDNVSYTVQKRYFYTGNSSKLWSSIGYYDMQDKSIHVSTGGKRGDKKAVFPLEDIMETAAHELGHHIYISIVSKRFKTPAGTIPRIRNILKGVKTSKSDTEHKQWTGFYKKDYGNDWEKNKALQIIPKDVYIRYGLENELFAQVIGGKTTISKTRRKQLVDLINQSCQVC
ncbi:MAG: hypothetical protein WC527_05620 [Candidatus Margulisiibacteriota bacterium]